MNSVIQTYKLAKTFKQDEVIKPLDFSLEKGEICALIGKNGAGKSTFFKMLAGQLIPTSGDIHLFGKSGNEMEQAKKRMGFMIETPAFFPDFTAFQNLEYFRIQRGVVEKERIYEVLQIVGLATQKKKRFKDYSMGMKQRLGIALCLLGSPDCLILDEPINGLDAEGIMEVRNLLLKLNQEKQITILVSSHILTELQLLARRFVFIKNGVIVEDLSREALDEKSRKQIKMKVDNPTKAAQLLERAYPDIQYKVLQDHVISLQNYVDKGAEMNRLFIDNGVAVMEFRTEALNLEEYFLGLVEGNAND
ncbi:ABC transporter ATP-binding protein [Virgibacillus halodenitrificans]|uniref:ATP-binding cassette domain-containing protein n=1 Tax=Virgibacillus halodenitrificans TaxID=1482 RepID=UPI001F221ABB|nr:ABC transporter ATP-binding protein [Virgibacillus halodenitrificans]MCG1028836.1 ABC transporter ATP-binding protein [Virgibacillus halodenitrificans]MEC2158876.1 ABC transporter ATP-binding protein [Virgibacillus halodenitrificans]